MKIILNEPELVSAISTQYPVPPGYVISGVEFKKYSGTDFCTISMEPQPEVAPPRLAVAADATLPDAA